MNNKELIAGISAQSGIGETEVAELLTAFSSIVGTHLTENDMLSLHALGTFEVKKRGERISVNPVSGKRLLIPPKLSPVFKPGGTLKAKIKEMKTV